MDMTGYSIAGTLCSSRAIEFIIIDLAVLNTGASWNEMVAI